MPAADFKVFDREGKEYTLASFKGKYIFLEFSASWCSWCKKEIPSIRQAYERFKDSVVFITIHLDDNRDKWLKDLETHAVPWYCLTDLKAWKSPVAKAYNIAGVPNCFIIGKDGLIKAKELRREEITQQLEKLLAAGKGIHLPDSAVDRAEQQSIHQCGRPESALVVNTYFLGPEVVTLPGFFMPVPSGEQCAY